MSAFIVATNIASLNSNRQLKVTSNRTKKSNEKLSSGLKINHAGDDAAGLAISEKMRNQVSGLNMASKNSADSINLIRTAEGALQETHEMLKRMRELVIQGANDTNVTGDREKIGAELGQLVCEIDATAERMEFNTKNLINGSLSSKEAIFLQTGAGVSQNIKFNIKRMKCSAIGISRSMFTPSSIGKTDSASFDVLLKQVDKAVSTVSNQRSDLGVIQNKLEHTLQSLDISAENLTAAESRIRGTDMAKEMMEFTKASVLSQAGASIISQANQTPNQVLSIVK